MHWVASVGELLVVVAILVLALGLAARRASRDWTYRVRLTLNLELLAQRDTCELSPIQLSEVVLVDPHLCAGSCTIAISPAGRRIDVGLLALDAPLGDRAAQLTAWRDAATPLLCCGDAFDAEGGAEVVLHGPDALVAGRLSWQSSTSFDTVPIDGAHGLTPGKWTNHLNGRRQKCWVEATNGGRGNSL